MNESPSSSVQGQDEGTPPVTVVTCIESGRLELEVPLMITSLREFGGRFARCPVVVVLNNRNMVPIRSSTRKLLADLDAQVVPVSVKGHRYAWWPFFNKPMTLVSAAPHVKTQFGWFLDGDIIVAKPPEEFGRHPEYDIQACSEDIGPNSTGPGSDLEPMWARMAQTIGVPLEKLPWVTTPGKERKVRIYLNSGAFRYRMGIGYEACYFKTVEDLLDARFVSRFDQSFFMYEQISMGLAVARLGLKFQELPSNYNFHAQTEFEEIYPVANYPDAILFHYHRALQEPVREASMAKIRGQIPNIAKFIEDRQPPDPSLPWKLRSIPRRFYAQSAKKKEQAHLASCERV